MRKLMTVIAMLAIPLLVWAGSWDRSGVNTMAGVAATWVSAPAATNSVGTVGQVARDTNYLYVCVATDTWHRTTLSTWE